MNRTKSVVVIGAGMAGLAAAQRLAAAGLDVRVLEKDTRPGGRVLTERVSGVAVDTGAQVLASFYTHTLGLIRTLGLGGDLVRITGDNAVVRGGRLYELRSDPTVLFTPLVSTGSKLALLKTLRPLIAHWRQLDVHAFARAAQLDRRSIAEYVGAELGDEALRYLIAPPLRGIFYYTPQHTSNALLFLLLKAAIGMKLYTLRGGLGRLPEAMAAGLAVSYGADVRRVAPAGDNGYIVHAVVEGEERDLAADGVVCALPAHGVAALFAEMGERQRAFFQGINYSSTVAVATEVRDLTKTKLYGFFCAEGETEYLAATTLESGKTPGAEPQGRDVIELFSSDSGAHVLSEDDDQSIRARLWADLERTGFTHAVAPKEQFLVRRWPQALPIFDVGHFRRLQAFEHEDAGTPALAFAGDYLGGPFVEGAVTSGLTAADHLLQRLGVAAG